MLHMVGDVPDPFGVAGAGGAPLPEKVIGIPGACTAAARAAAVWRVGAGRKST